MMSDTAVTLFLERVRADGHRPALRLLAAGGAPRDETLTWRAWAERARAFAAALVANGHRPGEHVAILAGNGLEWPVADLGVLMAGGVSVGIYPTSAPGQVRQVLEDCGAAFVVVDTAAQLAKVRAVRHDLSGLRTVVATEADGGMDVIAWAEWMAHGEAALGGVPEIGHTLAQRTNDASPDDTAILIYTSGSTGEPKGAMLSHRTILASAASIRDTLGLHAGDRSLSFLPFCHSAERIFGLYTRILVGMEAGLVPDHTRVWKAAEAFRPTLFGGLPRFYEKAADVLRAERLTAAGDERDRWERTLTLGTERSRLRRAGQPVPPGLEDAWRTAGATLNDRARALFGGEVRLATSGGATLPLDVAEMLDALGITILGGYGLTEHLCAVFNRPARYAFDNAGPPMPGTELGIAEDGEVLLRRGALTFSGYHGRPRETADAFTDDGGWLRTGDLGRVDAHGALRISGRRKELIALSNGKKIAPLPIESALAQDPWIHQAMLYGEGRRFVSALLVLSRPELESWARRHAADPDDPSVVHDPRLYASIQAAVDRINAGLSNPERVRRFALLHLPFEGDDLTPTLKLRRAVIAERHRDRLEALYQEP
ncbi:AMP-dependent synthetase/ligase [Longimicrobium sp.]|uniref:AMP-dependent synthetase/ligase n=1 Tax=Longimicrobium sp. TaxID=2029185 RepID=UPI002E33F07E|nr:AMP-binding protein [Longimicrobium sp.]HEX6036751.1 AMP-binding protein [Longimicrobium sp.]